MNDWVLCEILKCQHLFLDEINLKHNIARNNASLEKVYMMIICLELRIPLFIVGKPDSSNSLAKTIVSSLMSYLVKQGMELGKTVILLNCYNFHESLYDIMNQYYHEFARQR